MATVVVAGCCTVQFLNLAKLTALNVLLKVTASGCMFDFFVTLDPAFLGVRELDRDLKCGALSSAALLPAALESLIVRFDFTESSLIFCGFCLKMAATETDFLAFTGEICFGSSMPCRICGPGPCRSTSMLLH
jgi:hypothetical protein